MTENKQPEGEEKKNEIWDKYWASKHNTKRDFKKGLQEYAEWFADQEVFEAQRGMTDKVNEARAGWQDCDEQLQSLQAENKTLKELQDKYDKLLEDYHVVWQRSLEVESIQALTEVRPLTPINPSEPKEDELINALREVIRISDRKHPAWDICKEYLATKLPSKDSQKEGKPSNEPRGFSNNFNDAPNPYTPSVPDKGEGEEWRKQFENWADNYLSVEQSYDDFYKEILAIMPRTDLIRSGALIIEQANDKLRSQLQSLQAYNGKLVEALNDIRPEIKSIFECGNRKPCKVCDSMLQEMELTINAALSSFTDKTKDSHDK